MSIKSEINRISENIAAAYSELAKKGAVLPGNQNSAGLAEAISSLEAAEAMSLETIRAICV